jgi:hypothetical protein
MEIAIPILALGGMYVISNQKSNTNTHTNKNKFENPPNFQTSQNNQNNQENFTNMGKPVNYLPNTDTPPQNFPVSNMNQLVDTVQEYSNPNMATDKYFNQNNYEERSNKGLPIGQNPQQIYSMSGNYLESQQFKHNNMVPFNGGKVKGNTYNVNMSESILDNMIGNGSQVIKKVEQAPLFKPEDNVQWAYGAPNQSDFYQSRVNPGMKNNNIKPFESENVGPGLNQGYSATGSGGFNSGMESRDKWMPYTVDEMRVATNPKLEYRLDNLEGPANSYIKNSASLETLGRVEKQKPDTFFVNSQDRWLTTTGAEKGETLRSIQEMGIIRRPDCESNYSGVAGNGDRQAGYAQKNFEKSKRTETKTTDINHSTAVGRGPHTDGDKFIQSHTNYANHRSTVKQPDTYRSGFGGAIGAVIAPIMDILRPSRKEESTHNIRIYGEAGTTVPQSYVLNPQDVTNTTVKETTMYAPNFYINNQKEGMYVNNASPGDLTQRDTTNCSYIGTSGGAATGFGDMNYEAAYNQINNDIKAATIVNRPNQGGTQIFNQEMNVSISKQDSDRFNYRVNAPVSAINMPPSVNTYGKLSSPQTYKQGIECERIQPEILNAFRSNPYTHSLTTSV